MSNAAGQSGKMRTKKSVDFCKVEVIADLNNRSFCRVVELKNCIEEA